MTLKIEIASDGETATFRLCGQIDQDHLAELQAEVQRCRPRLVFDLAETTLVDLAVVRFLAAHEGDGVEIHERSEEHTSELQSLAYLVCRLLLEKKKKKR